MKKYLQKLPLEGLLIIVITLIILIVAVYLVKIDSVVTSHNQITVTNINSDEDNNALFISENDIDKEIILEKPVEKIVDESIETKKMVRLFFIKVDNDGAINLKSVLKSIYVGKTPLTKSLNSLLEGPDTQEINRGLLTLIPEGSKIISISITNEIAYINFNEMFRFNSLGVEGYMAQIKQIVYTATEYESVKSVQFLIDGSIQEYLGPEGVYIGRPISRSDLEL